MLLVKVNSNFKCDCLVEKSVTYMLRIIYEMAQNDVAIHMKLMIIIIIDLNFEKTLHLFR